MYAHSGFVDALNAKESQTQEPLRVLLTDRVKELCKNRNKTVSVTGHSLGGALATHSAVYVRGIGATCTPLHPRPSFSTVVYTFGSPRVSKDSSAAMYDAELKDKTFCIVHQDDIVTQVPLYCWGYRHVGNRVHIQDDGAISSDPAFSERLLSLAKRITENLVAWTRVLIMLACGGVGDHFLRVSSLNSTAPVPKFFIQFLNTDGYIGALAQACQLPAWLERRGGSLAISKV